MVGEAKVFGGSRGAVPLVSKKPVRVLVPARHRRAARGAHRLHRPAEGSGRRRAPRSRAQVTRGDMQALEMPLYAGEDVGQGDLQQRAFDGLLEFGTGLGAPRVRAARRADDRPLHHIRRRGGGRQVDPDRAARSAGSRRAASRSSRPASRADRARRAIRTPSCPGGAKPLGPFAEALLFAAARHRPSRANDPAGA